MSFENDREWWEREYGPRAEQEWADTTARMLSPAQLLAIDDSHNGLVSCHASTRRALRQRGLLNEAGSQLAEDGERVRRALGQWRAAP